MPVAQCVDGRRPDDRGAAMSAPMTGIPADSKAALSYAQLSRERRAAEARIRMRDVIYGRRDGCDWLTGEQAVKAKTELEAALELLECVGMRSAAQYVAMCGWDIRVAVWVLVGPRVKA